MKLRRIEAGRFGRIDGGVLDGLSPRLTVIHGPNEAGKSSFTALVRYVLYGFPTAGDKNESPYLIPGTSREARLVFADDTGEWVIERTEGVRGGKVSVRALSGMPRDGLVEELTTGVSKQAYRVVLGFGLSDLAQLDELKGQDGDLLARLYAAGAGITVSPIDVKARLEGAKEALWKKGGSAPVLNKAKADRDALRRRLRELELEVESLRAVSARLRDAEQELEEARSARTSTQARAEHVARAIAAAERLLEDAQLSRDEALRIEREADDLRARAIVEPDEAALAAADGVESLAEGLSGFREQLTSLSGLETRLSALDARLAAAVADTSWSVEQARIAAADAGIAAEIESFRERLSKARARLELVADARAGAAAQASVAQPVVAGTTRLPALVMGVLGAVGIAAGVQTSQWLLAAFGAVLVVAAVALGFTGRPALTPAPGRTAVDTSADEALEALTGEWSGWLQRRGLGAPGDDPAAVSARYAAARAVRELDAERAQIVASITSSTRTIDSFVVRVASVCGPLLGLDVRDVTAQNAAEVVTAARARTGAAQQAAAASAESAQRMAEFERASAEALRRASDADARAREALASVSEQPDLESARNEEVQAREAARDAADAFDSLAQEVAGLREKLGADRRENEAAELQLDLESVNERLASGVREYAVLTVASALLSAAQERYERDRQPEVVKHAEAAFARMTNGRYSRLTVPLGKDSIEVFDRTGEAMVPGKLSRGTAEQLYLALRIGLIDQLGQAGASLPVLMDDVLVNFSPDRAEPAASAIANLATRRQVIFFTCHPSTAELLLRVAPDAVRIDLGSSC